MTQKELLYVEDALGHFETIIGLLNNNENDYTSNLKPKFNKQYQKFYKLLGEYNG